MKFSVGENKKQNRLLIYRPEEYSFDMKPIVKGVDFDLVINKINLSVVKQEVVQVWGFCGLSKDMVSSYNCPKSMEGSLNVISDYKHGFAYGISELTYPTYVNPETGWVCLGRPDGYSDCRTVEFINNCIAVIEEQELIALWLKMIQLKLFSTVIQRMPGVAIYLHVVIK